ncbi:MAG: hypothetical protein GY702_01455 [Desulfobulbaceae bacterium]|nr:hypothetical protein [Desulfobulbaceae bacterium]
MSLKNSSVLLVTVQAFAVSYLFVPSTAYAYVDPGSGSVIVTTVLGLIATVGYTFRKYFYKLKRYIMGSESEVDPEADKESEDRNGG